MMLCLLTTFTPSWFTYANKIEFSAIALSTSKSRTSIWPPKDSISMVESKSSRLDQCLWPNRKRKLTQYLTRVCHPHQGMKMILRVNFKCPRLVNLTIDPMTSKCNQIRIAADSISISLYHDHITNLISRKLLVIKLNTKITYTSRCQTHSTRLQSIKDTEATLASI